MADWQTTTRRHGTQSGWALHKELGEQPCDPCYQAKAAYDQRRKTAPGEVAASRLRARAQRRAHQTLAQLNPTLYRALYQQFVDEEQRAARPGGREGPETTREPPVA